MQGPSIDHNDAESEGIMQRVAKHVSEKLALLEKNMPGFQYTVKVKKNNGRPSI
jgi:hypothetical protein